MTERKNMTSTYQWKRYEKDCLAKETKPYQYRQFCDLYAKWCEANYETIHIQAVIGQNMEVDFAGKTFDLIDKLTGEITSIVVFVAVLPYSQYIYAEGMISTKDPQWIEVNNHALGFFGGVPAIVVCDNCKQAVIANRDWINPDLNKDYAEWAEYNHTIILPAKVRKPKYYRRKKCYRKFYERFSEYANVPIFAEVFFLIIFSLIISIAILILTTGFTCDRKEH